MLKLKLPQLIFMLSACVVAQRRIKGGRVSETGKNYVVYLVKAPSSPQMYDAWLCGGAIVTEWYIITSAACVEDVQQMYAISGYKKYVPAPQLDDDNCILNTRKKIVFTCVPKAYELDYAKVEKWAYIDIAVIKVDTKYAFDNTKQHSCDYTPAPIPINYDPKHQEPGVDAMVLGWGHLDKWRKPGDPTDYNQPSLNYASALVHDKSECKKYFTAIQPLASIIDKYMICTLEGGNIDDRGEEILKTHPYVDGCTPRIEQLAGGNLVCEEDETVLIDETRKDARNTYSRILNRQQSQTRRQGICQNDHGGPLVTWVGTHEVLIGVASVFRVTSDSQCTGPYLYTSTQCNGAFIHCIISMNHSRRNSICDKPPAEKGFDTISRTISWEGHPDGPSEHDKILYRPQEPLYNYQYSGK